MTISIGTISSGKRPKTVKVSDIQTILEKEEIQVQMWLADQLEASQIAILMQMNGIGELQKVWLWVPDVLNETSVRWR